MVTLFFSETFLEPFHLIYLILVVYVQNVNTIFNFFITFCIFHISHNPGYIKMYNFCHILSFLNTINRTI